MCTTGAKKQRPTPGPSKRGFTQPSKNISVPSTNITGTGAPSITGTSRQRYQRSFMNTCACFLNRKDIPNSSTGPVTGCSLWQENQIPKLWRRPAGQRWTTVCSLTSSSRTSWKPARRTNRYKATLQACQNTGSSGAGSITATNSQSNFNSYDKPDRTAVCQTQPARHAQNLESSQGNKKKPEPLAL